MITFLYEIFDKFEAAPTKQEKVGIFRQYDTPTLRMVLRAAFHPNIHFLIEKIPDYTPSTLPIGMNDLSIHGEMKRLYLFERGNPNNPPSLTQEKREKILASMLEYMEAKEAVVFSNMLMKDLKVKGLDAALVREVFPGIIP